MAQGQMGDNGPSGAQQLGRCESVTQRVLWQQASWMSVAWKKAEDVIAVKR